MSQAIAALMSRARGVRESQAAMMGYTPRMCTEIPSMTAELGAYIASEQERRLGDQLSDITWAASVGVYVHDPRTEWREIAELEDAMSTLLARLEDVTGMPADRIAEEPAFNVRGDGECQWCDALHVPVADLVDGGWESEAYTRTVCADCVPVVAAL